MLELRFQQCIVMVDEDSAVTAFNSKDKAERDIAGPCDIDHLLALLMVVNRESPFDRAEHVILHTWLLEYLNEPYSPLMFARARHLTVPDSLHVAEESLVCAFQAHVNGGSIANVMRHFQLSIMPPCLQGASLRAMVKHWRRWEAFNLLGNLYCRECGIYAPEEGKETCEGCAKDNAARGESDCPVPDSAVPLYHASPDSDEVSGER